MNQRKKNSEGMKNLSVRISESQREGLRAITERSGIEESKAIRHAIDMFLSRYRDEGPLAVGLPDLERAGIRRARTKPMTEEVIEAEIIRRTPHAISAGKQQTARQSGARARD